MTSQADGKQTGDSQRRPLAARFTIRLLKVLLWTVLALNLTIGAVLICTVKILNPESLTPLVETIANKNLHANVRLSRIEFKLRPEYRGLGIEIDSLLIISKAFDSLPAEHRCNLAGICRHTCSRRRHARINIASCPYERPNRPARHYIAAPDAQHRTRWNRTQQFRYIPRSDRFHRYGQG